MIISKSSKEGSIKVSLMSSSNVEPEKLISHAALTCYNNELPDIDGKGINVYERLYKTGHHTTLQHYFMTFAIEGVSVGDVTFGLHLANSFYNSDQRSGRFCSAMFSNPNYDSIGSYIEEFWSVGKTSMSEILKYLHFSIDSYQNNLEKAVSLTKEYLKKERPKLSDKILEANSIKIAQEQLRMFIPVVFPTALDYTINLSSLIALWQSAWNPVMREVTNLMRDLFLEINPSCGYFFGNDLRMTEDWYPKREIKSNYFLSGICKEKPSYDLHNTKIDGEVSIPKSEETHPVDLLQFHPKFMDNSSKLIRSSIHISCATMGQDQRHRTIKRTMPNFTGCVYAPPLLKDLGIENDLIKVSSLWNNMYSYLPKTLSTIMVPYGSMVSYEKTGDLNAIMHETEKRLCWNTQEEIYHLNVQMREKVLKLRPDLEEIFSPHCIKCGKCGEGTRYCGRDLEDLGYQNRKV